MVLVRRWVHDDLLQAQEQSILSEQKGKHYQQEAYMDEQGTDKTQA